MTPERYQEIKQMLTNGLSISEISRVKKATRRTVRAIRDGAMPHPKKRKKIADGPAWCIQIPWQKVFDEATGKNKKDAHPLKFIWKDYAADVVGYKCFLEQFYKLYPNFKGKGSTPRNIPMGQQCEVDYMGYMPEWIDKTGEVFKAPVFVGTLCGSHLIFCCARKDATSANFIDCHVSMYEAFGGVPSITVPDCLKTGVIKTDLYDPDLNAAYADMGTHYGTSIVPARVRRPKDKPIVEGAVKIVTLLFKWRYRKHIFISLKELNDALYEVAREINERKHTRFGVPRKKMWQEQEKALLKKLQAAYEYTQTKIAKVHPDCHIALSSDFYSVPHQFRGEKVTVKFTARQVRVFSNLECIAVHKRSLGRQGTFVTIEEHLPPNARAYREATPQRLLTQAKLLNESLYALVEKIFERDTVGNIRRVQGLVQVTKKEMNISGDNAKAIIKDSIDHMLKFNKIRVPFFRDALSRHRKVHLSYKKNKTPIERNINNPMIRYKQSSLDFEKENGNGKHVVH